MQSTPVQRMPMSWPEKVQKLRPEQIANQATWGRVPDVDMTKAASHSIRVVPAGSTTATLMNELDPGITTQTVTEGRGWAQPPRAQGLNAVHGRTMR